MSVEIKTIYAMRKWKTMVLVMGMLGVMSACGKDPLPGEDEDPAEDPTEQVVRFSVLGDSYSTFEGYVYPDSNSVWYCLPPDNLNDVTSVEEMWWYQVQQAMGWTLERNNSFSGSLVCNMDFAHYYGPYSFLRRMDNLGQPDVILIFGGTNDVWDEAPMGDFVYENWTEEQLCTFRPALACLFQRLRERYPNARPVFLADTALGDPFMESVHVITSHYGVLCVDLSGIKKYWEHPTVEGMTTIASQVVAKLRS